MVLPTGPRMGFHAQVADAEGQARLAAAFYDEAWHRPQLARAYDGVPATLAELGRRGLRMGVVSNNQGRFIRAVLARLDLGGHFVCALGEEDMPAPKPDPRGAREALARLGLDAGHCAYVGDAPGDCQLARACGMAAIGVTWGIHTRDEMLAMGFDLLIDQPEALLALA
jgi:HAD superfamily hydrolase (TIGR01662 family)